MRSRSRFADRRSALALALAVLALALALAAGASPAGAQAVRPQPGASGVGDRLFPELGNGGYDVRHYQLDYNYNADLVPRGFVSIWAEATRSLRRFNLDFAGGSVERVVVDGVSADWDRDDEELVIWPDEPLAEDREFRVDVAFRPDPARPPAEDFTTTAFIATQDGGSVTAGQPNLSHSLFPSNDHPRDKATYAIAMHVPAGTTAVANGVKVREYTRNGRTHAFYAMRKPMASELIQLAAGPFEVLNRPAAGDVQRRDVVAPAASEHARELLGRASAHLTWLEERLGAFPLEIYGGLAADASFGFALETQSLTLYPLGALEFLDPDYAEEIMVHETAHEWFGNSVSPDRWRDIWLSEGHASWYEYLWAAGNTGFDLEAFMRDVYADGDQWRADFGPVARPDNADVLYSPNVYEGGALVLYALRQTVGAATFERIERTWVDEYADDVASTQDFIRHASRIARRDLRPFLNAWLYGDQTPAMPGHPDWEVRPAGEGDRAAPGASARRAGDARLQRY